MRLLQAAVWMGFLGVMTGCAAAAPPVARVAAADAVQGSDATPRARGARATSASAGEKSASEETAAPVPTACGEGGKLKDLELCMPEKGYAKKLCGGIYPDVALTMFGKTTPWTRVFLAGDVEAWNASGGLTHRAKLAFDEEVLVLGRHGAAATGGIVMTGAQASYDVMRWDGSCVSVMEGEITTRRPPAPKPAEVPFSRLEETTRHALLAAPKVKSAYEANGKACAAVATPGDKKACEKADRAFTQAIVEAVRAGGTVTLPMPSRRP